ncbi:alpha/beta fold hydrolase [Streptomyces sp. NPDC005876]|uniref:alpha/beta fold hydrolase n=1 Tax=Streptomyces sp. NPDC005876 TaxID=3157076 RepID=UPI00340FA571
MRDKPPSSLVLSAVRARVLGDGRVRDCAVLSRRDEAGGLTVLVVPHGAVGRDRLERELNAVLPREQRVAVRLVSHLPPALEGLPQTLPPVTDRRATETLRRLCDAVFGSGRLRVSEGRAPLPDLPVVGCEPVAHRPPAAPRPRPVAPGPGHTHQPPKRAAADGREDRAYLDGGAPPAGLPESLPELLHARCGSSPGEELIGYVRPDGSVAWSGYPSLRAAALRVTGRLLSAGTRPGDAVVLCADDVRAFFEGLWGCLLGGFVPAPVAAPPAFADGAPGVDRLAAVAAFLPDAVLLTTERAARTARPYSRRHRLPWRDIVTIDADGQDTPGRPARVGPNDVALNLFTSGSTGRPKAVVLTHAQVLAEAAGTARAWGTGGPPGTANTDLMLSWMPPEHGGSIAMMHTTALLTAMPQILAMPQQILGDIARWPALMSRHGVTVSWAPQFAYGLLAEYLERHGAEDRDWDLSRVRLLVNGGEAVVSRAVRRFLRGLAPYGLPPDCVCPAWGMAETSSGVVYGRFRLETSGDDDAYVRLGGPIAGARLRVMAPDGAPARQGEQGALEVSGATVTSGYRDNPAANAESFTEDGWFRTGDTALVRDGQLTVTGRTRDTIIINGANYFSHEIESVVEEIDRVESSYVAACAVRPAGADTEQLAVFVSVAEGGDRDEVLAEVSAAVARSVGVRPDHVVALRRDEFPKTDLGKIQRGRLAERLRLRLEAAAADRPPPGGPAGDALPAWFFRLEWVPTRPPGPAPGHRPERLLLWSACPAGADESPASGTTLGCEVLRALRSAGRPVLHVTAVRGAAFTVDGQDVTLDPAADAHLDELTAHLGRSGPRPGEVVFLPAEPGADASAGWGRQSENAYQLVRLLRLLEPARPPAPPPSHQGAGSLVHLRLVSTLPADARPGSGPACGDPLHALATTAATELPWLYPTALSVSGVDPRSAAVHVLTELEGGTREARVAFLGGARHTARLLPHLPSGSHACGPGWRRGGRYVITGGLGALGTHIAEHLLTEWDADVLLLSRRSPERTAPDSATGLAWRRLRGHGRGPRHAQVDVTDREALRTALDAARDGWGGEPTAVLHLAALAERGPCTSLTVDDFERAAAAKVRGAEHLTELLRGTGIALVLFSSAAALTGSAHDGAYAWAGALLDRIALREASAGHPVRSIAWGLWHEQGLNRGYATTAIRLHRDGTPAVGDQRHPRDPLEFLYEQGLPPLSVDQGLRSLAVCLAHPHPYLVAGVHPHGERLRHLLPDSEPHPVTCPEAVADDPEVARRAGALLSGVMVRDAAGAPLPCRVSCRASRPSHGAEGGDDLVGRLRVLVAAVLGLPDVAAEQDLFALGAGSLQLSHLHVRMEEEFDRDIPWQDVLGCRTVTDLAALVSGAAGPGDRAVVLDGVTYACHTVPAQHPRRAGRSAGPAVTRVLIPGNLGMHSVPRFSHLLADDAPLLVVDLPGSGSADDVPPEREGFAFLTRCLDHLLDTAGHQRIDLIGLSYGGSIAYAYARRHPGKVAHLVLAGTVTKDARLARVASPEQLQRLRDSSLDQLVEELMRMTMCLDESKPVRDRDRVRELIEKTLRSAGPRSLRRFITAYERMLTGFEEGPVPDVPSLVFTGEHDVSISPDLVRDSARVFPRAVAAVIRETDHMSFLQRPEETVELITRFLRDDLTTAPAFCAGYWRFPS